MWPVLADAKGFLINVTAYDNDISREHSAETATAHIHSHLSALVGLTRYVQYVLCLQKDKKGCIRSMEGLHDA